MKVQEIIEHVTTSTPPAKEPHSGIHFEGIKVIAPDREDKIKEVKKMRDQADQWLIAQDELVTINKSYNFATYDIAIALHEVVQAMGGGIQGRGAEFRTITTDHKGSTETVPWQEWVKVPNFDRFHVRFEPDGGQGAVYVRCPMADQPDANRLQEAVGLYLKHHSIYRGKMIDTNREFLDPWAVDWDDVVYTSAVKKDINAYVFDQLLRPEKYEAQCEPYRTNMLLYGPYGTGKTMAASGIAQVAERAGVTTVVCLGGQDFNSAIKLGLMYQPSVVFIEDIDTKFGGDHSAMLEALDGQSNKGAKMKIVMTTNFPERIPEGAVRPGRIDITTHVGEADFDGFCHLFQIELNDLIEHREDDLAKTRELFAKSEGMTPAYVRQFMKRAKRYALAEDQDTVTFEDLFDANEQLRQQLGLQDGNPEKGESRASIDSIIHSMVQEAAMASSAASIIATTTFVDEKVDKAAAKQTERIKTNVEHLLDNTVTRDEDGDKNGSLYVER